jgi:putative ABC transport system ATP-binding protein
MRFTKCQKRIVKKLIFDRVIPAFLEGGNIPPSEVWNTNLTLNKGERYIVEAPSGRGKSTFLGILFGSRKDFKGHVSFDEMDVASISKSDWSTIRSSKISMLFQELRLFEMLTVRENLELKLALNTTVSIVQAEQWLARLGLEGFMERKCQTLSYGQQQRVAIVRALCQPFEWLLLDEPFSHLDERNATVALELIQEVCAAQNAGLIVTSLGSAQNRMFDRSIIL